MKLVDSGKAFFRNIKRKWVDMYYRIYGYTDAYWYSLGKDINAKFIGWSGNDSSQTDPERILEETVTFKKNFKTPVVRLKLKRNGRVVFKNAKMKFLRVLYPIGRCFSISYPPNAQEYIFNGLILSQSFKDISNFFLDKDSGLSIIIKS